MAVGPPPPPDGLGAPRLAAPWSISGRTSGVLEPVGLGVRRYVIRTAPPPPGGCAMTHEPPGGRALAGPTTAPVGALTPTSGVGLPFARLAPRAAAFGDRGGLGGGSLLSAGPPAPPGEGVPPLGDEWLCGLLTSGLSISGLSGLPTFGPMDFVLPNTTPPFNLARSPSSAQARSRGRSHATARPCACRGGGAGASCRGRARRLLRASQCDARPRSRRALARDRASFGAPPFVPSCPPFTSAGSPSDAVPQLHPLSGAPLPRLHR